MNKKMVEGALFFVVLFPLLKNKEENKRTQHFLFTFREKDECIVMYHKGESFCNLSKLKLVNMTTFRHSCVELNITTPVTLLFSPSAHLKQL